MTLLSPRVTDSIKLGLAVVIAYAIAMSLGWEKPYWAAYGAIMISLDTAGQSLNKAALRMLGTLVGGVVAFILIALFPQERWSMVLSLSLYYGICTYLMLGSRRPYFWFVSAFVCMLVMIDAAPADPLRSFQIIVARVQETGMGILVYSVLSVLLWPRSSQGDLDAASRNLVGTQRQIYQAYRDLMVAQSSAESSQRLRMQEVRLLTQVRQALNAAETDSYQVFEIRHQWRAFRDDSTALMETLERWREGVPEVRSLDLAGIVPGLADALAELDDRFGKIERMLDGDVRVHPPNPIDLELDRAALSALSHFEQAAVTVTMTQFDRLDRLSRALWDSVGAIKDVAGTSAGSKPTASPARGPVFDLDRLGAAARVMAVLWLTYLIWIYVDPPGHALLVSMVAQWTLVAYLMNINPVKLTSAFLLGIGLSGFVYVFVMPHLSGYIELGLMLFVVHAGVFYLFWAPPNRGVGTGVLALLNALASIVNEQTYDFASFANTSAAMLLSLALGVAIFYVPSSPRPEKIFLRLLRRFFRHAEFTLSRLAPDRDQNLGWVTRWRMARHQNDLLDVPTKLGALAQQIDYRMLPGTSPEQVQALATSLEAVAYRIKEMVEARAWPQADLLVQAVQDDLRDWRLVVQGQCGLWAEDPARSIAPGEDLGERLAARLARLEARVEEAFASVGDGTLSAVDYQNFYRYLGTLRGVSASGVEYAQLAARIDWPRWQEARF